MGLRIENLESVLSLAETTEWCCQVIMCPHRHGTHKGLGRKQQLNTQSILTSTGVPVKKLLFQTKRTVTLQLQWQKPDRKIPIFWFEKWDMTVWYNYSLFSSLLSCVWLFATPWTTARQASLSITNSWSLLKLKSIESVMPSNHLILSSPSPLTFSLSQCQGLFHWVSS